MRYCAELDHGLAEDWLPRKLRDLKVALERGDGDELVLLGSAIQQKLSAPDFASWLRKTVGSLKVEDPSVPDALRLVSRGRLATCNYDDVLAAPGFERPRNVSTRLRQQT